MKYLFFLILLSIYCCSESAKKTNTDSQDADSACTDRVLMIDDSIGAVRNHACETIPLSETIRQYSAAIAQIDFHECPPAFAAAFEKHRKAWDEMIPFAENYPAMRGEMHDLFDELEKGEHADDFKPLLKAIWDTWAEVEAAQPD